jgi:uncharacterized protein
MHFKFMPEGATSARFVSLAEFERATGIVYLSAIELALPEIRLFCTRALVKAKLSQRQKWFGHFYAKEMEAATFPDLLVKWIDPLLGYGVFAEGEIPAHAFIGEYTGVVRERRRDDRSNHYCFDYAVVPEKKGPYIIDAKEKGNLSRFINHSASGNLEPLSLLHGGVIHIVLHTKRKVRAGEQLCYDYGEEYWKKRGGLAVIDA